MSHDNEEIISLRKLVEAQASTFKKLEEQGRKIEEQGQMIREQGQTIGYMGRTIREQGEKQQQTTKF